MKNNTKTIKINFLIGYKLSNTQKCINCYDQIHESGINCCEQTGQLLETGAHNVSKGAKFFIPSASVKSQHMDSRYQYSDQDQVRSERMNPRYQDQGLNQYDSVYIMVNGKRCQGNIQQINGNNAIVEIDPACSNGIRTQTVSLDTLKKIQGGRKIKTKINKKGKMKNKRNKTTKKYRRKRTLKKYKN